MIHLSIDAVSGEELLANLTDLTAMLKHEVAHACACHANPAKDENVAPVTVTTDAPPSEVVDKTVVRAALSKLKDQKGADALRAILSAHGATTFPTLKPEEYAAVLKEAQDATD